MSNFMLKLEPFVGSDIKGCAEEAIRLANMLGVTVVYDFNGITVMACPGDDACKTVKKYEKSMPSGKESIFQIITGH